jgi:uncharacterized membrane protein
MLGAVATATADTWATEIGTGFKSEARLITTGQVVPAGTSGGVTLVGSLGSMAGAAIIGLTALLMAPVGGALVGRCAIAGILGGVTGSVVDSLLGATIQARRRCPVCRRPTERRVHCDGTPTLHAGGARFIDNDVVNAVAGIIGAGTAVLLLRIAP